MVGKPARIVALGLSLGFLCCLPSRSFGQQTPALISTGSSSGLRLFAPNSNNWWFDPLAGRLDIRVNGAAAPAATLNSLGYLGIGTALPATTLDVNGTAQFGSGVDKSTFSTSGRLTLSNPGVINNPGSIFLNMDSDTGGSDQVLQVAHGRNTYEGGTVLLTVQQAGNVGIGTTNPTSALNVFNGNIKISTNTGTSYGIVFQDGTTQTTAAGAGSAQSASTFTVLSAGSYAGNTCPACTAACIAGSTITLVTANTSVTVSLASSGMQNTNSAGVSAGFLIDGAKPDNNLSNWMTVGAYSNAVVSANFSYTTINKLSAGPHSFCLVVNGIGSLANSSLLCSSFVSAAGCVFQVREYH